MEVATNYELEANGCLELESRWFLEGREAGVLYVKCPLVAFGKMEM